jgi:hypothetical protein
LTKYSFITQPLDIESFGPHDRTNLYAVLNDWGRVQSTDGAIMGFKTSTSPQGLGGVTKTRLEDGLLDAGARGATIPPFKMSCLSAEMAQCGTYVWDGRGLVLLDLHTG